MCNVCREASLSEAALRSERLHADSKLYGRVQGGRHNAVLSGQLLQWSTCFGVYHVRVATCTARCPRPSLPVHLSVRLMMSAAVSSGWNGYPGFGCPNQHPYSGTRFTIKSKYPVT